MRNTPLLIINLFLLLLSAVITSVASAANERQDKLIRVLNPAITNQTAERVPLTPRLDSLEGKTLYMVDNQWGGPEGAYQLFEEMQVWFAEHMPSVKVIVRRTRDNMFGDDPALWQEISEQGDAAIIGTGQ